MPKIKKKVRKDLPILDGALCKWLGDRLAALAASETFGVDGYSITLMQKKEYREDWGWEDYDKLFIEEARMSARGLLDYGRRYDPDLSDEDQQHIFDNAQTSLRWVATYLPSLSL